MLLLLALLALPAGLGAGCATPKSAEGDRADRKVKRRETVPGLPAIGLVMRPPEQGVHSVQLYRQGDETSLPVVVGGEGTVASGGKLVLEFDRLGLSGSPLDITFFHFDRYWREDYLEPTQILDGFQRDTIDEYDYSRATRVPYTHYSYLFPNDRIRFRVSGNWMLRVSERSEPDKVLLERPFLVSEDRLETEFEVQLVLVPGTGLPFTQPSVRILPPQELAANVFDFRSCFVRNARFELARCNDAPTLLETPYLRFYLDPRVSFTPDYSIRTLDLTALQPGPRLRMVHFDTDPFAVELEPDYERLGANLSGRPLFGQSVFSASALGRSDADVASDYVDVTFEFVPEGGRSPGDVRITGSFSGWTETDASALTWNDADQAYRATLRLKQGLHEYHYVPADSTAAERQRRGVFNPVQRYSALVYLYDTFLGSDRLVAHRTVESR